MAVCVAKSELTGYAPLFRALAQTIPTHPCTLRLNVKRLRDCNLIRSDSWHLGFSSISDR